MSDDVLSEKEVEFLSDDIPNSEAKKELLASHRALASQLKAAQRELKLEEDSHTQSLVRADAQLKAARERREAAENLLKQCRSRTVSWTFMRVLNAHFAKYGGSDD